MKIYSWNMLFRNRELDRAFDFVSKSDFDIFCLQEVPEEFLTRLQASHYVMAYQSEREMLLKKGPAQQYLVILSKHPIVAQGEIPFPEYWSLLPLRTRIFIRFMPSKFFTKIRNRAAMYVDISINEMSIRVFNLHLILAQPAWRLKEFEMAMTERDSSRPTIVCGDFNTIEAPHISLLNWLLGGRVSDAFLHRRERTNIERRFVQHELVNALAGSVTHQLSRSQLDHILVSHTFAIKKTEVIEDRIGSDHHPIRIEVV